MTTDYEKILRLFEGIGMYGIPKIGRAEPFSNFLFIRGSEHEDKAVFEFDQQGVFKSIEIVKTDLDRAKEFLDLAGVPYNVYCYPNLFIIVEDVSELTPLDRRNYHSVSLLTDRNLFTFNKSGKLLNFGGIIDE